MGGFFLVYLVGFTIALAILLKIYNWKMNFFITLLVFLSFLDPALIMLNFMSFLINDLIILFCFSISFTLCHIIQMNYCCVVLYYQIKPEVNYQIKLYFNSLFRFFNCMIAFYDWRLILMLKTKATKSEWFNYTFTEESMFLDKVICLLLIRILIFCPVIIAISVVHLRETSIENVIM